MIAYRYDEQGIYVGQDEAFIDPLESKIAGQDVFVLPADCTFVVPLADLEGFVQRWKGTAWEYVENHIGKTGYVNGEFFEVKEYGPLPAGWSENAPDPTEEDIALQVRMERDAKLIATDKYLVSDFPIDTVRLEEVKKYREALRALPEQKEFPTNVVWPVNPMA